jgi:hypothetical protein
MPEKPTQPTEPIDPMAFDEFNEFMDDDRDDLPDDGREEGEERSYETPEADAEEQRLELLRVRDTPLSERALDTANPADAAEQTQVVDPGDEEYR